MACMKAHAAFSRLFAIAAGLASLLPATVALAHQYWLAPSHYRGMAERVVEIGAGAGTGFRGERKPWSPPLCVRFIARATRTLDLTRAASPGAIVWARFVPSDAGGAMLAYESTFTPIELPASKFDAYLEEEGLLAPLAARARGGVPKPGRERYRRCAKSWLAGNDPARATVPLGLPLEIVPAAVPGSGAKLRVRVLWMGKPLAGALVKAWRSPIGSTGEPADLETRDSVGVAWSGWTDSRGEVAVPVAKPGEVSVPAGREWLVSVVHMEPCRDSAEADWESTWASLTFESPAEWLGASR
jgi:hypothetical protein